MQRSRQPAAIVRNTYYTFGAIMIGWIGAWLLKLYLEEYSPWLETGVGSFAYWSFAKLLLWIMPALCLLRISQRSLLSLFNFSNWRKWLAWGGGLGAILGLMGIVSNYWQGEPIFPTELSWPLVNVLVTAPILEEFLMRGAIMGNLERGGSFWIANGMSALMFLILHVPGWLFMGTALNHALPVFLLGLAFGYATKRSGSIMGGIIAHFLNNLF